MKLYPVLVAIYAINFFTPIAMAGDQCIAYGDERTDFTWRLCPAGEKHERQYLYFGAWSTFYRVKSDAGACSWSEAKSSWVCPDTTIRCDSTRCGLE
jgi:hypothetical protein